MIAKLFCIFWLIIAAALWIWVASQDANLLFSACIGVSLITYAIGKLDGGAWSGFQRVIVKHSGALIICVGGFATTLVITSMIAGDWAAHHRVQATCVVLTIGTLHIHHWAKGLAILAWHGDLLDLLHREPTQACQRGIQIFANRSFAVAGSMLVLCAVLVVAKLGTPSLRLDLVAYAIHLIMMGVVCRTTPPTQKWFRIYMGASLGISAAIFGSGCIEIFRDFVVGGRVPQTLIFWYPDGDSACNP